MQFICKLSDLKAIIKKEKSKYILYIIIYIIYYM